MLTATHPASKSAAHVSHGEGYHSGHIRDRIATPAGAYAVAWSIWFTYLLIPLFMFLGTLVYLLGSTTPTIRPELGQAWFLTMMVAIAAGIPLAFYIRGKAFFYGFWSGRTVTPHQYIYGSLVVWTVIELIGILSLLGCLVTGDLAPNLVPALIAFVVFVTQWPNATALYKNTGNRDDSSEFVHPR